MNHGVDAKRVAAYAGLRRGAQYRTSQALLNLSGSVAGVGAATTGAPGPSRTLIWLVYREWLRDRFLPYTTVAKINREEAAARNEVETHWSGRFGVLCETASPATLQSLTLTPTLPTHRERRLAREQARNCALQLIAHGDPSLLTEIDDAVEAAARRDALNELDLPRLIKTAVVDLYDAARHDRGANAKRRAASVFGDFVAAFCREMTEGAPPPANPSFEDFMRSDEVRRFEDYVAGHANHIWDHLADLFRADAERVCLRADIQPGASSTAFYQPQTYKQFWEDQVEYGLAAPKPPWYERLPHRARGHRVALSRRPADA